MTRKLTCVADNPRTNINSQRRFTRLLTLIKSTTRKRSEMRSSLERTRLKHVLGGRPAGHGI